MTLTSHRARVHGAANPRAGSRRFDLVAARLRRAAGALAALSTGAYLGCSTAATGPTESTSSTAGTSSSASTSSSTGASSASSTTFVSGSSSGTSSSQGGSSSGHASSASSSGVDASSSTDGALAEAGGGVDGAAASGDGGTAAAGCGGKPYKLCEDYNTGAVGQLPAQWTLLPSFGQGSSQNIGLATDEFHSPPMSLKTDDLGNADAARSIRSLADLGATASKNWGRIFFKVQAPKATFNGFMQNTWVALRAGQGDTEVVDTVEMTNATHQWTYLAGGDNCGFGSAYDWTFDDAWHCAEWYIDAPASSSYRFFYDSVEVTMNIPAGKTCTEVAKGFTDVVVGSLTYVHPPGARTVWFDDLAIDDNRIGCN